MAESDAQLLLESNFSEAEEVISNPDALENLLQRLEEKLRLVPLAGDALSNLNGSLNSHRAASVCRILICGISVSS